MTDEISETVKRLLNRGVPIEDVFDQLCTCLGAAISFHKYPAAALDEAIDFLRTGFEKIHRGEGGRSS